MREEVIRQFVILAVGLLISWAAWKYYESRTFASVERYWTFSPRLWAGSVDNCVIWPVSFVVTLLLAREISAGLRAVVLIVESLTWLTYSVVMHARYGQTVGKMLTKVRVVDSRTEGRISWRQAVLRDSVAIAFSLGLLVWQLVRVFSSGWSPASGAEPVDGSRFFWVLTTLPMLWFAAEVITMRTNRKRRALHDFIAGTVVIRTNLEETAANEQEPG